MPNERVKFFKPSEEIKEKIVYVKDKDILGFDSASIYEFHYNLFKMKKFGLSENFILNSYYINKCFILFIKYSEQRGRLGNKL